MIAKLRERHSARAAVAAVLLLGLVSSAPGAEAGEMTRSGQNFQHAVKFVPVKIGDVEGHIVAAFEQEGLMVLADGEVAQFKNNGTLDYVNWEGTHSGYLTATSADGSTTTSRYEGTTKKMPEGRIGTGTYIYVGGTGKFAGIKGEGTYRGTHHGKMSIYTWEEKITLPD